MSEIAQYSSLRADAAAGLDAMTSLRRAIHREPEVGLHLPLTQAKVLDALNSLCLPVTCGTMLSSVVATIEGARPGPTVLLRADMDALPIAEERSAPFPSLFDGYMHACGHDAHTAMLVGAAHLLAKRRNELAGSVRLFFQPGEEAFHGGQVAIDEGLLDNGPSPVAAFALHVMPNLPTGVIATRAGPIMAAGAVVRLFFQGRAGHAAMPHLCVDPVPAACHALVAMQTLMTREVVAGTPAVLSITGLETSSALPNLIPEEVRAIGTLRTCGEGEGARLGARLDAIASSVASGFGAKSWMELEPVYPLTANDADVAQLVLDTACGIFGKPQTLELSSPNMATEDFGYILKRVPGAMAFLGVGGPHGDAAPLHSPKMVLDEEALAVGATLHAALALRLLQP